LGSGSITARILDNGTRWNLSHINSTNASVYGDFYVHMLGGNQNKNIEQSVAKYYNRRN